MSWILRKKKKAAAILALVFLPTPYWYLALAIWLLIFLYVLKQRLARRLHLQNEKIANHPNQALSVLHNRKEITPIHTLFIGDTCSDELVDQYKRGNALRVQFPDRSLGASYHIFMHIESVLEEKGRVVILHDRKVRHNNLTFFDLPFIHFITIKESGMEGWQKKYARPLLYAPIRSIKFLRGSTKTGYRETACPMAELVHFCKERNIDLIYLNTNYCSCN